MSDNTLQFKWIVTIKEGLEAPFRDDPNVFVAGGLLWYPVKGEPKIRTAPDAMVAFGRPRGHRGSSMQWVEGGIAPQVVFEVDSSGNRPRDMARKLQVYDRYGADEFTSTTRTRERSRAGSAARGALNRSSEPTGSEALAWASSSKYPGAPDALIIRGPDGDPFETYVELFEDRVAARRRADAEHARVERLAAR